MMMDARKPAPSKMPPPRMIRVVRAMFFPEEIAILNTDYSPINRLQPNA